MDVTWTITELADFAAAALAADGSAQVSGRVRDLPNERLIRWYTTIGLVDPPLGRRGRTSLYGPPHLLQLDAVKRRQSAGLSIAEIQTELTGATDAALERIAALPYGRPGAVQQAPAPYGDERTRPVGRTGVPLPTAARPDAKPATGRAAGVSVEQKDGAAAHEAFGDEAVADARTLESLAAEGGATIEASGPSRGSFWNTRPDMSFRQAAVAGDYGRPHPPVVQGVRLAPGLTLLLDVSSLSGDDLAAIENAARPLLDELHRRGILVNEEITEKRPAPLPADPSRRST